MGSFFTKLSIFMYPRPNTRILMLGLDAAGKTTILYKLKLGKVVSSTPTIGFNFEEIEYKNIKCSVWDVGGQTKMRALWKFYYLYTQGLIFVVDSCDRERIELAKEVLHELMREKELRDAVLLVFANKQDMGVMNVEEVAEKLGLHSLTERKWHIQGTCAVTGDGLYKGLDWLIKAIQKK